MEVVRLETPHTFRSFQKYRRLLTIGLNVIRATAQARKRAAVVVAPDTMILINDRTDLTPISNTYRH